MLSRWFDKKQESGQATPSPGFTGPRVPRHSGGWATLRKRLQAEPGLRVIDVGQGSQRFMEALATASKGTAVPYLTVPQLDPFARRGTKSGDKS